MLHGHPPLRISAFHSAFIGTLAALSACSETSPATRDADAAAGGSEAARSGSSAGTRSGSRAGQLAVTYDAGSAGGALVISPQLTTLTVDALNPQPVQLSGQLSNGADSSVDVQWRVDRRELGTIDATTGLFTPTGAAGPITITARAGSLTTNLMLTIVVQLKLEGDPDAGGMPAGAGGLGGVGGEGAGAVITSMPLRAALDGDGVVDPELTWLYPYDETVWPRGLPAPLLQWKHGAHAPLAVKLKIDVEPSYHAEIYLGAPMGLAADQPIDRLPIPQAVWRNALQSGSTMTVALTAAASDGSGGYTAQKAATIQTWHIAQTSLKGTVYYNSYGTKLVENSSGALGGNGRFGGATLAIQRDSFDPALVAGTTTTDESGCRVCHTVSANGSVLLVQHPNYASASSYDLRNMNKESMYPTMDDLKFGWAALSPDGTVALGNAGPPGSTTASASSLATSSLWKVSNGSMLTANGLSPFVTQAATPMFSPSMTKVAFNLYEGAGTDQIAADGRSLVVMDLKRVDDSTYDFSNARAVFKASGVNQLPGWPFFLPDDSGVIFQLELVPGSGGSEHFGTRFQARGELWWADLDGHAHALDRANGKGYLPTGPLGHDADTTLQYEPTVAPIVAGGYAWVVFTSRRLYGNVATREPFESDPHVADLTPGNDGGPTTKKLWVAAISVPPKPDSDPSHPAFYLPAQELYAGNSRGFWALDACKEDAASCSAGDECCGGFCTFTEEFSIGVCASVPPTTCAKEYDKCNVDSDCCTDARPHYCTAGRCAALAEVF